jgi:hypothetical protein
MGMILKVAEALDNKQMRSQGKKIINTTENIQSAQNLANMSFKECGQ